MRTSANGDGHLVAFCGELDLANVETARAELGAAFEAAAGEVVLDLRELEFIDSAGIALLVATLHRERDLARLRCVPSTAPAVTRVLRLTGIGAKLPVAEGSASPGPG